MNAHRQPVILVVDDDPGICRLLNKRLGAWNYSVITAEGGFRAAELIQQECPKVVITDLFMPDGDGFELLLHIRETAPDLPVIVMSGQGDLKDAVQALRLGAWDYLIKPFGEKAFLQRSIDQVLEKARLIRENRNYRDHLEMLVAQKNVELAASEKHYRTVADFTFDWEYWIAPDGKILYMSPSCQRITGYSPDAFSKQPGLLQQIVHHADRAEFVRHLNKRDLQHDIFQLDFRIVHPEKGRRWIGHHCQPVFDVDGSYLGRRCSNRDITYQKQIENDLIRKQQSLVEKAISQKKANEALRALLRQREIEQKAIEQSMVSNLRRYVSPYLDELDRQTAGRSTAMLTSIIRTNIDHLVAPVYRKLSGAYLMLTPMEVKVADLIRQGASSKSIADFLNMSVSTVEKHRNKIRKKLNLLKKKVNLQTFLNSLT